MLILFSLCLQEVSASHTDAHNEAELVRAAQADTAAFGELYRRYMPRIYSYLRARSVTDEEAADLTQQVFVQALDALPEYREQGLPFAAWLFRIARNIAVDARRRRKTTLSQSTQNDVAPLWQTAVCDDGSGVIRSSRHGVDAFDPETALLRKEDMSRLRQLLGTLPMDKLELLALRFAAGLTISEISVVTGKSKAATHKQLSRLLHHLREEYLKEEISDEKPTPY